jgi:hypothetical protein
MLQALSPMVAVALARAEEARQQASMASTGEERDFWRKMERRWIQLAQSEEFAERTAILIEENRRKLLN